MNRHYPRLFSALVLCLVSMNAFAETDPPKPPEAAVVPNSQCTFEQKPVLVDVAGKKSCKVVVSCANPNHASAGSCLVCLRAEYSCPEADCAARTNISNCSVVSGCSPNWVTPFLVPFPAPAKPQDPTQSPIPMPSQMGTGGGQTTVPGN